MPVSTEPLPAFPPRSRGRILVVGAAVGTGPLTERLARRGFTAASVNTPAGVAATAAALQPEAILLSGSGRREWELLDAVRERPELAQLPLVARSTRGRTDALKRMGVRDWIRSDDALEEGLEAVLRAHRLIEREARARLRLELLLEIAQTATQSLELGEVLRRAAEATGRALGADRSSVILVEGDGPRVARVIASREGLAEGPLTLDLMRYPELLRALETREAVYVHDLSRDPLMADVRQHLQPLGASSVLVQPLVSQDDVLGALFLRVSRAGAEFGREEREFVRAVAAALSNSVRNARLHGALKKKRDELESAYVDRYQELTEANRRLKNLNRLKDEIIAVCSHDLRAPLQVLLGHGQLLLESLEPGAETQQRLSAAAILRQGKKILNLVESLLDRGRGEATRISLDGRTLDISEVCKEAAQELAILAAERGIALRAETPESLTVYGDEIKLRQVLQNLITHGIARSPNNGSLTVRAQRLARPDGDVAKVFVEDIGPALSPEELPMAFDRYGADPSGPGLGLAICRQLAELHGGEVYAENRREGGAAFTVLLPLAQALPKTTPRAVKHPQVLLVEDEPEVVALVVAALRSRYRVTVAADGAQGLAQARALRPDAIVMDVFLPRTDGLEAAVALKSAPDTAGIPVILLSADQRVADKVRALGLEGVDTVAKPVQASELIDRVERVLRLRETQLELERSQSLLRRAGGDPETGLLDRGGLLQRLEEEVARAQRYGRPWVLALLTAQRPLGEGLRTCATALRDKLRPPDAVAHLGGGTFVLVLPELPPDAGRAAMYRLGAELRAETGFGFDFRLTRVAESASGGAALAQLLEESGD